jgi:hypothetical protein
LDIKGLGHVPAFKNKKIIVGGNRLITAPKAKKWMISAQKLMYSQLKSKFQTTEGETSTVPWQLSAMSSWPSDDNCKVITEIHVLVKKVPKGEEGATVWIEKISPID